MSDFFCILMPVMVGEAGLAKQLRLGRALP